MGKIMGQTKAIQCRGYKVKGTYRLGNKLRQESKNQSSLLLTVSSNKKIEKIIKSQAYSVKIK